TLRSSSSTGPGTGCTGRSLSRWGWLSWFGRWPSPQPLRACCCGRGGGNALVVLTWIVTRTVGSLVGPAATAPAQAGFGDLVATALQVLIVAGGCGLLTRRLGARTGAWTGHAPVIAALIVVPFLVLALYSAVGGAPFVTMVG